MPGPAPPSMDHLSYLSGQGNRDGADIALIAEAELTFRPGNFCEDWTALYRCIGIDK